MTALELAEILDGMRLPAGYNNGALKDAAGELRRLAELERDAARYRWLRLQHLSESQVCVVKQPPKMFVLGYESPQKGQLDAAIDAAMGEAK